ncbi:MAG: hypothetical protein AAF387_02740 [Pseudomonadota bacterium]
MPKPNFCVVKFGGSLLSGPNFSAWINDVKQRCGSQKVVVVPGGGRAANRVRELSQAGVISSDVAHELALDAMRQNGRYIFASLSAPVKLLSLDEMRRRNVDLGLWVPTSREFNQSGMPRDWTVTSDSIALWLAHQLSATHLYLLKSAKPRSNDALNWSNQGYVDTYFAELLAHTDCPVSAVFEPLAR